MKTKLIKVALSCCIFWACFCLCAFEVTLPKTDYELTVFADEKSYTFRYPEIDFCSDGLYLKGLDEKIELIRADTAVKAQDAEITFTPKEKNLFKITREKSGKQIDETDLKNKIEEAINRRIPEIYATFKEILPTMTYMELLDCTHRRAEFYTEYGASGENRKHNVSLATTFINGTVIMPKEEFSFNKTVGQRTYDRGFTDAKIILKGKFTEGVGGGVCQVSSTLYNAALIAGLDVTERHRHSIAVSYLPPSLDAMVNDGTCDLKFVNNTGGRIFICAKADGQKICFTFYGKKNEYVIEPISKIIKIEPSEYEIIPDDGSLNGEEEIIITPSHDKIKSSAELHYFLNGEIVKITPISTDIYNGVKGVKMSRENKKAP